MAERFLPPVDGDPLQPELRAAAEVLKLVGFEIVQYAPQLHISTDIEADGDMFGLGSILAIGAVTPAGDVFSAELQPMTDKHNPRARQFCKENGLDAEELKKTGE